MTYQSIAEAGRALVTDESATLEEIGVLLEMAHNDAGVKELAKWWVEGNRLRENREAPRDDADRKKNNKVDDLWQALDQFVKLLPKIPRLAGDGNVSGLTTLALQFFAAGAAYGSANEQRRLAKMNASPARPRAPRAEIERRLLKGETNGQIKKKVPGAKPRTIERVRAALKKAGRLA